MNTWRIVLVFGLLLALASPTRTSMASVPALTLSEGKSEKAALTLDIEGADCASCSLTLRRTLKKLRGVEDIREGAHKKQVIVDFLPAEVSADTIIDAINKTRLTATAVHLS